MTAAQLRLLRIVALELRPDIVQQLQIALLGVLLLRLDERPAQGSAGLAALERVGTDTIRYCIY
jgi:hypothetical protein